MPIEHHPKPGQVFDCDFRGNIYPEIVKKRPVVILTPKYAQRADLVAVVPLSTTAPDKICEFHCVLEKNPVPGEDEAMKIWVKGDLVQTVTFTRLSGYWLEKVHDKRKYLTVRVSDADMMKIKKCVLHGLGFSGLTGHLK
jgi:mRNA interferase MazF